MLSGVGSSGSSLFAPDEPDVSREDAREGDHDHQHHAGVRTAQARLVCPEQRSIQQRAERLRGGVVGAGDGLRGRSRCPARLRMGMVSETALAGGPYPAFTSVTEPDPEPIPAPTVGW